MFRKRKKEVKVTLLPDYLNWVKTALFNPHDLEIYLVSRESEEQVIKDLIHEYIHYVLYKLFGMDVSAKYDKVCKEVEK